MRRAGALTALSLTLLGVGAGCGATGRVAVPGGDPHRGAARIQAYGCAGCHSIPGISGPQGDVGPSLNGLASRRTIAGAVPNTVAGLTAWIRDPQAVTPGTVMPDLGVDARDARDIAAYLYRH